MKKIIILILMIIGVGLLLSCVGKFDFDKLNDTTHDNQTTEDNNTTTIDEPDEYLHSIRIYYDGENYNEDINNFDFSFEISSESSNEINTYELLENYYPLHGGDQLFPATGIVYLASIGEVEVKQFAYESHTFYIGYNELINYYWRRAYVSLASDNNSFTIIDTVSLAN